MVKTIGNPGSWTLDAIAGSSRYIADARGRVTGRDAPVQVNRISIEDLGIALRRGYGDFLAFRSDVIFVVVLYPVIGICLAWLSFNWDFLPLLFPLMSGFAIIGPVAAVGLYEMSRIRESGQPAVWSDALGVMGSPAVGAMLVLGLYLFALFLTWMLTAYLIYTLTLGPEPPVSAGAFLADVFGTGAGWAMIVIGMAVGFVFAAAALAISIVSVPLLLDRHVGVARAIGTSLKVTRMNPVPVAAWGLIVAVLLAIGTITLFIGLIFVLPILGHATWHLYRRAVS